MEQKKEERKGLFGKLKNGYYRYKFFRRIEKDYVLITRNIFNGKKVSIKEGGFAFLFPWTETKAVSIKEKDIDYKPDVFEDVKGMDLLLDNVITVKITDPLKYEYEHTDIEGRLKNLLNSRLRAMLKKYPYEFLALKGFTLPAANSVEKINNDIYMDVKIVNGAKNGVRVSDMEPQYYASGKYDKKQLQACFVSDLARLRCELNQFEQKYGLSLVNFECKKIMPSEEVRKQQEALKLSEENIKIAENEAKATRIKAEAEAVARNMNLKIFIDELLNRGIPKENIERYIHDYLYTNGVGQDTAKKAAAVVDGIKAGMENVNTQGDDEYKKIR